MAEQRPIIVTYSEDLNAFRAYDPEDGKKMSYGASRMLRIGKVFADPNTPREKRFMYMRFMLELAQNWVGLNSRERRNIKFFFLHRGVGYQIPEGHNTNVGYNAVNQIWPSRQLKGTT